MSGHHQRGIEVVRNSMIPRTSSNAAGTFSDTVSTAWPAWTPRTAHGAPNQLTPEQQGSLALIDALRNSPVLGSSTYLYNVATGASAERASAATQLANLISDIGASVVLPRTSVSPVTGQTAAAVAANSAPRVYVSNDPIVGETATTIDQFLPGAVKNVNVPIKNTEIGLSSDADIMLKNGDVIEVKSGGGKGATTQVANQIKIIGKSGEVIVYGPDLKPSVVNGIQNSGTKVFTNLDNLLAYLKSKGL